MDFNKRRKQTGSFRGTLFTNGSMGEDLLTVETSSTIVTMKPVTTLKVWVDTRKKLRLIAAMTDVTIMEVVDQLATAELKRLQEEQK